jgi:IclR family transcriptional regulator, KDG regulon repressor
VPAGALERAVELLGLIGEAPTEPTVAALASDAGMPTSTAYRLIAELEQHGLVQRGPDKTVALGLRIVALGRAAEARVRERLVLPARPLMTALSREVGETVILTVPSGLEAIVLDVVEAELHPVRLTYARFRRAPMHRGASGKVLAAYLDAPERARVIEAAAEPGLETALDQVRRDGFVVTRDEVDHGASAAAAPILDRRGRIAAGLSVAGPSERMARRLDAAIEAVRAAAAGIERACQLPASH